MAEPLHISKKTIYTVYPSKEALLLDMVFLLMCSGSATCCMVKCLSLIHI